MGRPRPRTRLRLASLTAALALAAVPTGAQVSINVVNGAQELAEPSTGGLVKGDPASGFLSCTVTLVGCDAAITTAHCFNSQPELLNWVYFQHAGFVAVESATRNPAYVAGLPPTYDADALRVEDIAFIKLAAPVTGIEPSTLVALQTPPAGTPGRIVGFGRDPITAPSAAMADYNAGIKRSGSMQLTECADTLAGYDLLCWDPPAPQGPTGTDVSTCDGDSGGPLFVNESGTRVVAGLTKGHVPNSQGQPDLCIPPVSPYDTNVYRHLDWIHGGSGAGGMVAQTGAQPLTWKSCSALPQLPDDIVSGDGLGGCDASDWDATARARTCGFSGYLDAAGAATASHEFSVPPDTALLRVAFNGIASPNGSVDTNYYLRAGAPPTTSVSDCAADGTGTLGYCEVANPAAGPWHVLVVQAADHGEYQVTVSTFAAPLAVPASGSVARALLAGLMLALAPWRETRRRRRARRSRRR